MKFAHDRTLPSGRYLSCVLEPQWAKSWSRSLKRRIDDVTHPHWCADFAWYRDPRLDVYWRGRCGIDTRFLRGIQRAYAWLPDGWVYCDIVNFFGSVDERHLRRALNRAAYEYDPTLPKAVSEHLTRIGFDLARGLPTGSAVACALANVYLLDVDRRFRGDVLRFGDNYAVKPSELPALRKQLRDIGLHVKRRSTFTKSHDRLVSQLAGIPLPPPAAPETARGNARKGREGRVITI